MAYEPCSCHGDEFRGRSVYAYPALLNGDGSSRSKLRLCPRGATDLKNYLTLRFHESSPGKRPEISWDNGCDLDDLCDDNAWLVPIFVTVYFVKDQRRDFFALVCETCLPGACSVLSLAAHNEAEGPSDPIQVPEVQKPPKRGK